MLEALELARIGNVLQGTAPAVCTTSAWPEDTAGGVSKEVESQPAPGRAGTGSEDAHGSHGHGSDQAVSSLLLLQSLSIPSGIPSPLP